MQDLENIRIRLRRAKHELRALASGHAWRPFKSGSNAGSEQLLLDSLCDVDLLIRKVEKRTDPKAEIPALMGLFNLFLRLQIVSTAFENGHIVLKSTIRFPDDDQIKCVVSAINDTLPDVSLTVDWCGCSTTMFVPKHEGVCACPHTCSKQTHRPVSCYIGALVCPFLRGPYIF